jgi:hypothetical protein
MLPRCPRRRGPLCKYSQILIDIHALNCKPELFWRDTDCETTLADHQAEIDRLLNSIQGGGSADFFRQSVQRDASEWIARTLLLGANIGVGPKVSASIVLDALNEIRAAVADRLERERAKGRLRGDD